MVAKLLSSAILAIGMLAIANGIGRSGAQAQLPSPLDSPDFYSINKQAQESFRRLQPETLKPLTDTSQIQQFSSVLAAADAKKKEAFAGLLAACMVEPPKEGGPAEQCETKVNLYSLRYETPAESKTVHAVLTANRQMSRYAPGGVQLSDPRLAESALNNFAKEIRPVLQ
jgi:hypothetical protein